MLVRYMYVMVMTAHCPSYSGGAGSAAPPICNTDTPACSYSAGGNAVMPTYNFQVTNVH